MLLFEDPYAHRLGQSSASRSIQGYRFLLFFGADVQPVAAVSKVTGLKRFSDVINRTERDSPIFDKSSGGSKYNPITLERGVTQNRDFIDWAGAEQRVNRDYPISELVHVPREVRLQLLDETGQPALGYIIHHCWVSELHALPDLDLGANALALEHLKIENEGWEVDPTIAKLAKT